MSVRFPLCAQLLGLDITRFTIDQLEVIENKFSSAPAVFGLNDGKEIDAHWGDQKTPADTHTARLLLITPIAPPEREEK